MNEDYLEKKLSVIKKIARWIIGAKKDETIKDCINRKKSKLLKFFYKKKYGSNDIKDALVKLGIEEGDNIIVHSSYREFYNFTGTPNDIIDLLKEIIGDNGTLLMPAYGNSMEYFDVKKSKSKAGVISECFRKELGVIRSECSNFSIAAYGKNAEKYTKEHYKSSYGFDEFSPYYKLANGEKGKVLMFGLGKYPVKNTIFHFAGFLLKDQLDIFRDLLSEHYDAIVVNNAGKQCHRKMITRGNKYRNSSSKMKKIFKLIPEENRKHIKISNLNIVVYDAKVALDTSIKAAYNGITIYKNI